MTFSVDYLYAMTCHGVLPKEVGIQPPFPSGCQIVSLRLPRIRFSVALQLLWLMLHSPLVLLITKSALSILSVIIIAAKLLLHVIGVAGNCLARKPVHSTAKLVTSEARVVRGSRQGPDPDEAVAVGGGQPGAARRCQNLSTI